METMVGYARVGEFSQFFEEGNYLAHNDILEHVYEIM